MKKVQLKFSIRREIKVAVAGVILLFLIAFTEIKSEDVVINTITIKLGNIKENHFMEEADVVELMQLNSENLKGAHLSRIHMRDLERKIKANRYIRSAQLYSDLKGNLIVSAELHRPIARLMRDDGPGLYVAEDGSLMPVSHKFSSRVLILGGSMMSALSKTDNLNKTPEGVAIMEIINRIHDDEFWSAQIAEVDVATDSRTTIYPQIGGQVIEFGKLDDQETKFKKMMIFYKEILPRKGWNAYRRVNLEYAEQIVAE